MKRLNYIIVISLLPFTLRAEHVALVVGIGSVREAAEASSGEVPQWDRIERLDARRDAESAFRELVPTALRKPHLYGHDSRWFGKRSADFKPAILLTDGFTDNAKVPVAPLLFKESRSLAPLPSPSDDAVIFLSGIGTAAGWDSVIYDRLKRSMPLTTFAEALPDRPSRGRRILVARIYSEEDEPPTTLFAADPDSLADLRRWFDAAQRQVERGRTASSPGRLLPALPLHRPALTPLRMRRLGERLRAAPITRNGLQLLDLGQAMEPVGQEIQLDPGLREVKIFVKVRRPGPFFTIIEEDSDVLDRIDRSINRVSVIQTLTSGGLAPTTARNLMERIEAQIAASFELAQTVNGVTYQIRFEKELNRVTVNYRD
ncbi:MAG: hypothetical protein AAF492_14255 [Verrucomicrobiota bacterium]